MLDEDIHKLDRAEPPIGLDHIESGIWAGVDSRLRAARLTRVVVTCQALVLGLGFLTSIVMGSHMAPAQDAPDALGVFSPHAELAPVSRLIGHRA